ncbi:Uncharacterised protein [Anaerococcus vaginalis]|uniref:Uncharacterized protein n=1 Tax=Anaerococcus vaginalis TaxID=33037 RepID=A0A6N2U9A3_9FIRM
MRGLKKFTSLLLALFIVVGNIVPAFADEIVKSNEKNVVEQSSQSNEENQNIEGKKTESEETFEKENSDKSDSKSLENKNLTSPLEKSTTLQKAPVEPGWGENRVIVQVNLHGLKGKEFNFSKIFPKEKFPNGPSIEVIHFNEDTFEDELIGKEKFTLQNTRLDLGIHQQVKIDDFEISLDDESSDKHEGKIIENQSNRSGGHDGTSVFNYDIYKVQNTNAKFKTIDKDGKTIENPTNLTVTYQLGDKLKANQKLTSAINEEKDMLEGERFKSSKWEGNYDGTNMPEVSLENTQNGYFLDGDYAYKILDQKQKDDDKSNPLEVTLIRKQKVIKGGEHPKYKDPISGKEIDDPDYVKVEFKVNDHGSIDSGESVYWVLKDLDIKDSIKAPKVKLEYGYGLKGWKPWFKTENQKYSQDTTHVAIIDKIKYFDYLTFSGDVTTNRLTFHDASRLNLIGFVDKYGIYKEEQIKSFIDFEDTEDKVRVTLENGVIKRPGVKELKVPFQMKVDKSFGDDILNTPEKQLVRETTFFANDIYGNTSWYGIRYTIKNQNTKGTVTPKEKETLRYVALTKEEIYEAVKNGEFVYNDGVPDQNKSGKNALHREVEGENLLNPEKVKKFNISDEDYKKLDFSKLGYQEVPVTITYLDNSKSTVNVKIKIKENVPTGIIDNNYQMPKILLLVGFIGVFVSVINFRKKFLKNYE